MNKRKSMKMTKNRGMILLHICKRRKRMKNLLHNCENGEKKNQQVTKTHKINDKWKLGLHLSL